MKDEKDRIKALTKRERDLEKALADAHLKIIAMESLIESVEDHFHIDVKKNFGEKAACSSAPKLRK